MNKCNVDFNRVLQKHLWKSELECRAKQLPRGSCVDWLAAECSTPQHIATFLRSLGFRILEIVDFSDAGEKYQWVETTSGIIVFANSVGVSGLVAARYC